MKTRTDILNILLMSLDPAHGIPAKLLENAYRIEERVQFDHDRSEAAAKIRDLVEAQIDKEFEEGAEHGHAS